MKRILSFLLVAVMLVATVGMLTACSNEKASISSDFKIGFIFLHDENSTYDKNFLVAAEEATAELGLKPEQVIFKTNVPKVTNVMKQQQTLQTRAAISYSRTPLVTSPSFFRQLRNSPRLSSATQQVLWLTPRVLLTSTMHLHLSTRADILQVSLQV